MKKLRILLFPFSWLYGLAGRFRNWLFDSRVLPVRSFEVPLIGIGNLSAGGTGKTPMAEYLLKFLLETGYTPALLSRGYGRFTKGFHIVKPESSAEMVGDEPCQIKRRLPSVMVAVSEDRGSGVEKLLQINPGINAVVLDDAFQHRKVKCRVSILLTAYDKPYYKDKILPAGMLREAVSGKARADVIIMTKCPAGLTVEQKDRLKEKLKPLPEQKVFFTSVAYKHLIKAGTEESFSLSDMRGYRIILFTGIAQPEPLLAHLQQLGISYTHFRFADHHVYRDSELRRMARSFDNIEDRNKLLLTTEKDWRRLEHSKAFSALARLPLYYLPIEVEWNEAEKQSFNEMIISKIKSSHS